MSNFDSNGNYNKTNWKTGDKITADKLNKIEESLETINDKINDLDGSEENTDLSNYATKDELNNINTRLNHMVSVSTFERHSDENSDLERLNRILSDIGEKKVILMIDTDLYIDGDLTIPRNIDLYFMNKLILSDGITLQIDGFIIDVPRQIFEFNLNEDLTNSCTILGLIQQDFIRPEWFGAIGDGVTDDSPSFQKAFNVAKSTKVTKIKFTLKIYYIASTINITYFDLILEGIAHDKFETTDQNIGCILFSNELTNAFHIETERGFGASINNLFFRTDNPNLTIFDFALESLPARNLTVEHCRFRGKCGRLFSFVMREENASIGTGVCTVTFRYNNFVGSGYFIYADGKYALMNTTIENNTIEWGMKIKSVNKGIGTNFVVRSNLFESVDNLFDVESLRANIIITNNYFEALGGLFKFKDVTPFTSFFEYSYNYDVVDCPVVIDTNLPFISSYAKLPSSKVRLHNNDIKMTHPLTVPIEWTQNSIQFATLSSVGSDIFNEAIHTITIKETDFVYQTKYGQKYLQTITGNSPLYSVNTEVVSGDVFVIITPVIYNKTGTTGYLIYDSKGSTKISFLSKRNMPIGEGYLILAFKTDFDDTKFQFRIVENTADTLYYSDMKVYKATSDGLYRLIY